MRGQKRQLKSVVRAFSYLRTLTTWYCPHSPAAAAAIDRYLQRRVYCWGHAGTDRRTETYYAEDAKNGGVWVGGRFDWTPGGQFTRDHRVLL